jgi:hypothetical protein
MLAAVLVCKTGWLFEALLEEHNYCVYPNTRQLSVQDDWPQNLNFSQKDMYITFSLFMSTVVTGLLTRCNTLKRYLYVVVLSDSPLCRRCGAQDETISVRSGAVRQPTV